MTTTFERRHAIVRLLGEQPGVRVPELADLLDVSVGTIRNDLNALQDEGKLRRVRGGAVLVSAENPPNTIPNQAAKQRLAQRAVEMVAEGDAIWLDAGTTVQMMVPLLDQRRDLMIVTNGLRVALQLAEQTDHRVLLVGGRVGKEGIYTVGMGNDQLLGMVNIRTAFISGIGFTLESGLTVSEYEDAQLKRRVIASAENVVVLIDGSKIGRRGFAPVATLQQLSHVLTDRDVSPEMLRHLSRAQVNVTICGAKSIRAHTVTQATKKYLIGFANQTEEAPFAVDVRRGLEQAVAARDDIDLIISNNKLSSVEALRVANNLIERRVDLMIEYQIDARANNLIIDKFQRANIPVIAVDIPLVGATFFGVDNYRGGVLAGQALGEWVQREWGGAFEHLVILEEPRAGDLPRARLHGQQDAFEAVVGSAEKITHLNCGNTLAVSQNAMRDFLHTIPATDRCAVLSFNDEAAVGAIRAARELGRARQLAVVGQGGDRLGREELRRPDTPLVGTTAYMPEKYGAKLIEIALDILEGRSVPPAIYMQHVFLTRDNFTGVSER